MKEFVKINWWKIILNIIIIFTLFDVMDWISLIVTIPSSLYAWIFVFKD